MPHGHAHDGPSITPSLSAVRLLTALAVAGALATLVGLVLLRPTGEVSEELAQVSSVGVEYDATVEGADLGTCSGTGDEPVEGDALCRNVTVRLLEGPDEGRTRLLLLPDSPSTPHVFRGDKVTLAYHENAQEGFDYSFLDRQRKPALFWLALVFGLAVVALGRLRGFAALVGLAITLVVLLAFVLPAIVDGRSPVLVAIVGSAAISFVTLYLAHGLTHRTTTALLGTLSSLALTALLAQFFVGLAKISGFATDEAILLNVGSQVIDIGGLVLAGVIIGGLGALDDVTVTQSSAIWELRGANPSLGVRELFRSGLRIGRDHIASTVNTLLLAYAGASLPLLLFFLTSQQSLTSIANQEIVATEIVRTLVGSIGLVCSVPITTWLAALVASTTKAAPPEAS
ncbi:MAG: YibE/F family protein [Actinomycetota bacterium]